MNVAAAHRGALQAPVLAVEGLAKRFGAAKALRDVSVSVAKGSLTVVLGAAGAGKTTLLRIIAGLERPSGGSVRFDGVDGGRLEPKDRDVAMIFDNLALYPDKTGFDNVANPLRIRGESREAVRARVEGVAATLKIAHVLARLPRTMSGGERQRVALGRALVRDPRLFLLDEPLSSLDALLRIELRAELRRLQRESGHTFLLATPDFAEALAVADQVVVLRRGRVVQTATPQALYDHPADRETARFVGAPEINLLGARYRAEHGGTVELAGLRLPAGPALRAALADGAEFEAGIRPEHITLTDAAASGVSATVVDTEPLGTNAAVTVETGAARMQVLAKAAAVRGLQPGERVGLAVAAGPMLAFDKRTGQNLLAPGVS